MADALDSKSSGGKPRVGSSPTFGTKKNPIGMVLKLFLSGFCNFGSLSAGN